MYVCILMYVYKYRIPERTLVCSSSPWTQKPMEYLCMYVECLYVCDYTIRYRTLLSVTQPTKRQPLHIHTHTHTHTHITYPHISVTRHLRSGRSTLQHSRQYVAAHPRHLLASRQEQTGQSFSISIPKRVPLSGTTHARRRPKQSTKTG
jgi:hypothetical protein